MRSFIIGHIYPYKQKAIRIAENRRPTPPTTGYVFQTRSSPLFTEMGKKWYRVPERGRMTKIVPKDLVLDPLCLCIWFMDDGCKEKGKNRCWFATNGFAVSEVERLVDRIKETFGLDSRLTFDKPGKPMIEIGGYYNLKKFQDIISPYIHWDCFRYKLESAIEPLVLRGEAHPRAKISELDAKKAIHRYEAGEDQKSIATSLGVKSNTLNTLLRGKSWDILNVPRHTYGTRGERNGRALLTVLQVQEIKRLHPSKSYSQLAADYQVSPSAIACIIKGRTWSIHAG